MSSPYYQFGYQRTRHAYSWRGGAGGIMHGPKAAETQALSGPDLYESGKDGRALHYPPLARLGDDELPGETYQLPDVVVGGPRLMVVGGSPVAPTLARVGGFRSMAPTLLPVGMSDSERSAIRVLGLGAAAAAAYYFLVHKKRKKPRRRR